MSDDTPSSYMDDGVDIEQRMPTRKNPVEIGNWVDNVHRYSSPASTALSYMDDGADLLTPPPRRSGIGKLDKSYYEDRNRKDIKHDKSYHPGVQRAVDGQIKNTLASMEALQNLRIRDNKHSTTKEKRRRRKRREDAKKDNGPPLGAVRIWLPQPPPALVIHGKDGHVMFADGDDDPIDSRPPPHVPGRIDVTEDSECGEGKSQQDDDQWQSVTPKGKEHQSWEQSHKDNREQKQTDDLGRPSEDPTTPTSRPDAWTMGSVGSPSQSPSPTQCASVWEGDHDDAKSVKSNYHAPTVEDAPETPAKEKRGYLNGYDEPYETYCNANWGGIPVRVGNWPST